MTAPRRAGRPALAAALLLIACSGRPVLTPTRSLDRPSDAALVCAAISDSGDVEMHPLHECGETATRQQRYADGKPLLRLFLLVSNTTRGEVALVSAGSTNFGAWDAGEPLNGDAGAQVIDLDPTQPGFGFLTVGALPEPIRVSADGCTGVTANQGDCNLSVIDVHSLLVAPACRLPGASGKSQCSSMSQLISSSVRSLVPALPSGAALSARPTWVELLPPAVEAPAGRCDAHPAVTALVAYPSCQLVAKVDLGSGKITAAIRFTPQGATVVTGDEELDKIRCDSECRPGTVRPAPDLRSDPLDLTVTEDGGAGAGGDGGLPPLYPTSQAYPDTLALDDTDLQNRVLYIGDATSGTITRVRFNEGGAFEDLSQIQLAGAAGGINRIRVSPRISSLALADPRGPHFLYVVARDGTVRVVQADQGVECETNPDWSNPDWTRFIATLTVPQALQAQKDQLQALITLGAARDGAGKTLDLQGVKNLERLVSCIPVGLVPRSPLSTTPGITLPSGALPRDVAFTRYRAPLPSTNNVAPPNAAPSVLYGDFAFIVDSSGRTTGVNIADLCPQPNILPVSSSNGYQGTTSCDDVRFGYSQLDPTTWGIGSETAGVPGLSVPVPRLAEFLPHRLRNGALRYVAPLNAASSADPNGGTRLAGYPQLSGATAPLTDPSMPRLCVLANRTCLPIQPGLLNSSPGGLLDFVADPVAASEIWSLAWEGELPDTSRSTGTVAVTVTKPRTFTLNDASAALCSRGVRPGDKLFLKGCSVDADCGSAQGDQYCYHDDAAAANGVSGMCLGRSDPSAPTACARWTSAVLKYRIVSVHQNSMELEELFEPEHPLDTHACTTSDECSDVKVLVPGSNGSFVERSTSCLDTGSQGQRCILGCSTLPKGDRCGIGYVCDDNHAWPEPRCVRAPLPPPKPEHDGLVPTDSQCFEEQQNYGVQAGDSFLLSGSFTRFLHTDYPDPGTGECKPGDDHVSGRIAAPGWRQTPSGNLQVPLCDARVQQDWRSLAVVSDNPCQLVPPVVCTADSDCPSPRTCPNGSPKSPSTCTLPPACAPGGSGCPEKTVCDVTGVCVPTCNSDKDCGVGGHCLLQTLPSGNVSGVPRCATDTVLHFSNPLFTLALDVPRRSSNTVYSRAPDDGAVLKILVVGGFRPFSFALAVDALAQMPHAAITGPDHTSVFVVDEGRQTVASGLRGQVLRFLSDVQVTDSTFQIR